MYEINLWPFRRDDDFDLGNAFFGAVKLTKNANKNKYKYPRYRTGFDNHGTFSLSNSSSAHVDNRKKNILIFGKGTTDGLDDTTLTAE